MSGDFFHDDGVYVLDSDFGANPVKPETIQPVAITLTDGQCPNCGADVIDGDDPYNDGDYCCECGQRFSWEDTK